MHTFWFILILTVGLFANMKIMDFTVFREEEIRQEKIKEKYHSVIWMTSIALYLLAGLSLFFSDRSPEAVMIGAMLFNMLFVIAITDYLSMYIYDNVLFGYVIVLFVMKLALGEMQIISSLYLLLIGGGLYGIIYLVAKLIYKKEAFGLGDVYLIAVISTMMSFRTIAVALFSPFYIAPVFLLIKVIADKSSKNLKLKSEIPFGPYICLGAWITYLYGDKIVDLYLNLAGL